MAVVHNQIDIPRIVERKPKTAGAVILCFELVKVRDRSILSLARWSYEGDLTPCNGRFGVAMP